MPQDCGRAAVIAIIMVDRGIHGVATLVEHLDADLGSGRGLGCNHSLVGA